MNSKNPSIVNISSIAGRTRSISLGCHYTTSKSAIIGMTRHLACELGPKRIRVNCCAPSQTQTPMLKNALSKVTDFSHVPQDKDALAQAKDGRLHILSKMNESLSEHRNKLSAYAPKIAQGTIPVDEIGGFIGPGGKNIKGLAEKYECEI